MPKPIPGTTTQNFAPDVKHKKHPMPTLPKSSKIDLKKPANMVKSKGNRKR